jgi:nicotinate phosphoribosyltransferase
MPWVTGQNAALLTDLYQLTMSASYFARGNNGQATFELFVRRLPEERNFLIACGLDDALAYLESFRFGRDAITYLRSTGIFREDFLDYLAALRFTGEAWAIPEGEAVFAGEPLLRVTAPRIEAQLVETFLLNCISFQTTIASKAARIAIACDGRPFFDFSARRDHGADAALRAARAAYIGGAAGTSNVLAGQAYGIPLSGTMAHSYVSSFASELDAFLAFARDFPSRAILLIDTYDTLAGARNAVAAAKTLAAEGIDVLGVRLDSGDLEQLAPAVRAILDEGGCPSTAIFASSDLDEHRISALLAAGAPVDAFGVGTQLGTSADAPALSAVYKLVEDDRGPQLKLSPGKATLPGRKQVYRFERDGLYERDVIALHDEPPPLGGRPLLQPVMASGARLHAPESLGAIRERCPRSVASLSPELRSPRPATGPYSVEPSDGLRKLFQAARARTTAGQDTG